MNTTKKATIREEKGVLYIQTPYSASLVVQLKDAVPRQQREWKPPVWEVSSLSYLDIVREIVSSVAANEGWTMLDYTAQTAEAIEKQQQEVAQDNLDRHVEAVLTVLPKLPNRSLRLVDWQPGHLTFELATFLDDKDLFKELAQASLQAYRPTILFGGSHKREFGHTFIMAADKRILHALVKYTGVTPLESRYSAGIEYFVVRSLTLLTRFEDGIAHFTGEDESFWIGIPYEQAGIDLSWSRESWQVTLVDEVLYMLFKREKIVKQLIAVKEHQYVNPGFGNVAVAQSHPSQVASFVKFAHIEEWFKAWGNALVESEEVKASQFTAKPHWYSFHFDHPGEELLHHGSSFRVGRVGSKQMWAILDWTPEYIQSRKEHIELLKQQAAQRTIEQMRLNAANLARPKLEALTIKDLLDWGAKYEIEVKKSWGKERIIETLNASTEVCEDIIGLTKRLEGK